MPEPEPEPEPQPQPQAQPELLTWANYRLANSDAANAFVRDPEFLERGLLSALVAELQTATSALETELAILTHSVGRFAGGSSAAGSRTNRPDGVSRRCDELLRLQAPAVSELQLEPGSEFHGDDHAAGDGLDSPVNDPRNPALVKVGSAAASSGSGRNALLKLLLQLIPAEVERRCVAIGMRPVQTRKLLVELALLERHATLAGDGESRGNPVEFEFERPRLAIGNGPQEQYNYTLGVALAAAPTDLAPGIPVEEVREQIADIYRSRHVELDVDRVMWNWTLKHGPGTTQELLRKVRAKYCIPLRLEPEPEPEPESEPAPEPLLQTDNTNRSFDRQIQQCNTVTRRAPNAELQPAHHRCRQISADYKDILLLFFMVYNSSFATPEGVQKVLRNAGEGPESFDALCARLTDKYGCNPKILYQNRHLFRLDQLPAELPKQSRKVEPRRKTYDVPSVHLQQADGCTSLCGDRFEEGRRRNERTAQITDERQAVQPEKRQPSRGSKLQGRFPDGFTNTVDAGQLLSAEQPEARSMIGASIGHEETARDSSARKLLDKVDSAFWNENVKEKKVQPAVHCRFQVSKGRASVEFQPHVSTHEPSSAGNTHVRYADATAKTSTSERNGDEGKQTDADQGAQKSQLCQHVHVDTEVDGVDDDGDVASWSTVLQTASELSEDELLRRRKWLSEAPLFSGSTVNRETQRIVKKGSHSDQKLESAHREEVTASIVQHTQAAVGRDMSLIDSIRTQEPAQRNDGDESFDGIARFRVPGERDDTTTRSATFEVDSRVHIKNVRSEPSASSHQALHRHKMTDDTKLSVPSTDGFRISIVPPALDAQDESTNGDSPIHALAVDPVAAREVLAEKACEKRDGSEATGENARLLHSAGSAPDTAREDGADAVTCTVMAGHEPSATSGLESWSEPHSGQLQDGVAGMCGHADTREASAALAGACDTPAEALGWTADAALRLGFQSDCSTDGDSTVNHTNCLQSNKDRKYPSNLGVNSLQDWLKPRGLSKYLETVAGALQAADYDEEDWVSAMDSFDEADLQVFISSVVQHGAPSERKAQQSASSCPPTMYQSDDPEVSKLPPLQAGQQYFKVERVKRAARVQKGMYLKVGELGVQLFQKSGQGYYPYKTYKFVNLLSWGVDGDARLRLDKRGSEKRKDATVEFNTVPGEAIRICDTITKRASVLGNEIRRVSALETAPTTKGYLWKGASTYRGKKAAKAETVSVRGDWRQLFFVLLDCDSQTESAAAGPKLMYFDHEEAYNAQWQHRCKWLQLQSGAWTFTPRGQMDLRGATTHIVTGKPQSGMVVVAVQTHLRTLHLKGPQQEVCEWIAAIGRTTG